MEATTITKKRVKAIADLRMLRQLMKQFKSMNLKRKAFLPVYVGPNPDRMRFLIPLRFLHFPIFKALLQKAEEEYGFSATGGIVLPCEVDFFKQVLSFLHKDEKKYGPLEVNEFLKLISEVAFDSFPCKQQQPIFFFLSRTHDN